MSRRLGGHRRDRSAARSRSPLAAYVLHRRLSPRPDRPRLRRSAALAAAWFGLLRRGLRACWGSHVAALLIGLAIGVMLSGDNGWALAIVRGRLRRVGVGGARVAFRPERSLPPCRAAAHPVLFVNPRSGDGRAARVGLAAEARRSGDRDGRARARRGSRRSWSGTRWGGEPTGWRWPGETARRRWSAAIAAEHDLPYACIPSGTRNHFALDLGVDREDVRRRARRLRRRGRALCRPGGGQRAGLRQQRLARRLRRGGQPGRLPRIEAADAARHARRDRSGPRAKPNELRWIDPDGVDQTSTALVLVSNNAVPAGADPGLGHAAAPGRRRARNRRLPPADGRAKKRTRRAGAS